MSYNDFKVKEIAPIPSLDDVNRYQPPKIITNNKEWKNIKEVKVKKIPKWCIYCKFCLEGDNGPQESIKKNVYGYCTNEEFIGKVLNNEVVKGGFRWNTEVKKLEIKLDKKCDYFERKKKLIDITI